MTYFTPDSVIISLMVLTFLESIYTAFAMCLQLATYNKNKKVPEELENSQGIEMYHQTLRNFGLYRDSCVLLENILTGTLIIPFELYFGLTNIFWQYAITMEQEHDFAFSSELIFCIIMTIYVLLKKIPYGICMKILFYKYPLDERMPRERSKFDFAVTLAVVATMFRDEYSFPCRWAITCVMYFIFRTLFEFLMVPHAVVSSPLRDASLRISIENLATSLKYPLRGVEVAEKAATSHKYFFVSKKVLLIGGIFNKGFTFEEIVALLAHEMVHWCLSHEMKKQIMMQINLLILQIIFSYCIEYAPIGQYFGFTFDKYSDLPDLYFIYAYIVSPYLAIFKIVETFFARRFEFKTDELVNNMGLGRQLRTALFKINGDSQEFPIINSIYANLSCVNPTPLQRMRALDRMEPGIRQIIIRRQKRQFRRH